MASTSLKARHSVSLADTFVDFGFVFDVFRAIGITQSGQRLVVGERATAQSRHHGSLGVTTWDCSVLNSVEVC